MSIDPKTLRDGDVVHIRGTVAGNYICLSDMCSAAISINLADYVHVEPRQIKVGDRVTWGHGLISYRVASIDGPAAFLVEPRPSTTSDFERCVEMLSDLRRV